MSEIIYIPITGIIGVALLYSMLGSFFFKGIIGLNYVIALSIINIYYMSYYLILVLIQFLYD
ncbi:MAG TPA: hypothetical protein DHU59_03780 [Clostridiales bacterium]|nr:hypothetical protein [Clostridiales bacterium]